jgi:sensor c-di-GMP phosphodiesterase-like protein
MIDVDAIRSGLNGGEFFVEYLPTVDLYSRRCVGGETLTRWRRPSGVVRPDDFIEVAEDTPLSGRITYWVIETLAREMGAWLRENRGASIAINVPPEILGRGGVEHALMGSGLADLLDQLVFEVTERGIPDAIGVDAINRGRAAGMRFALDDFGISDANLAVLSRVNVDIIKLSKKLVDSLLDGATASVRLRGLRALMRETDIQVIAEGVESLQQIELLKEAGVKLAQGWYFSPSLPAPAFQAYFHAHQ